MKPTKQEQKAYHEAGHAVLAYLMGRRIERIRMQCDDDPQADGDVTYCDPDPRWPESMIRARNVVVSLAGFVVDERRGIPSEERHRRSMGDRADAEASAAVIGNLWNVDPDDVYAGCLKETRELLSRPEHWLAVKTLAAALLEWAEIRGDEAERIIRDALKGD